MDPTSAQNALATDPIHFDRELIAKSGLWAFVRKAWPEIEPNELVPSWHLEEICAHLEAVSRGECKRLIINVPPGASKSTLTSVLWPAWDWIKFPSRKFMYATFDASLAGRDALRHRGLIKSDWYQQRWSDVKIDESGNVQDTQAIFSTTKGGRRLSVTVGGKATGWHANFQVIDDPIKPKDIAGDPDQAREALDRTWLWWKATMASRRADPRTFARVIIMQRLHEDDLVGRILNDDKISKEYTHLMLPMRFETDRACSTPYGGDRREQPGELLAPDRFDEKAVAEMERDMGSQVSSAQLQQRPSPASGNIFKREWFEKKWKILPADISFTLSVDCTFKDSAKSDFVALHVWGYARGKYYLVDRIHERMGLPETIKCIESLCRRYPKMRAKLIEDKANGPAVEQILRGKMPGIIMITPDGGKVARANAASPLAEAGNVILPDPTVKPWSDDVLEELVGFPFARNDDDVDAMDQALIYLHDHSQARYLEAMDAVRTGKVHFLFGK